MADCINLSDKMLNSCVSANCSSDLYTKDTNFPLPTVETTQVLKDADFQIDKDSVETDINNTKELYFNLTLPMNQNVQLSNCQDTKLSPKADGHLDEKTSCQSQANHLFNKEDEVSEQSYKNFQILTDLKPTATVNSSAIDFGMNSQLESCGRLQNDSVSSQSNTSSVLLNSHGELSSNQQLNDIVELISDEYKCQSHETGALDVNSILIDQEPIDIDEDTTQPRFSSCSTQESILPNHILNDHMFVETTLAQSPNDSNSDVLPKMSCHLPISTDEESDKESNVSVENSDFIRDLTSCTSLTPLEESSLDSGIASLDDTENAAKSITTDVKGNSTLTKTSTQKTAPTSILGKKRSFPESSSFVSSKQKKLESSRSKVVFNGVTIFYFPRKQSFVTVPSQGGSTLGMSLQHNYKKHMTLNQHKRSIARHRRKTIEEHKKQLRLSAKLRQLKQDNPEMETSQLMSMIAEDDDELQESSEDDELEDDATTDDDFDDDNYFLQPIPAKKRRLLLRMAGVQKIDLGEKFSNKATRESREVCGCTCVRFCAPLSCQCALAGIPCQVDRESFPCGCVATGCHNPNGRVEFDAERVKRHYAKTMKMLRLQETGLLSHEQTELPQPPKSPYVSRPEPMEEYDQHPSDPSQSSMQQVHESNPGALQTSYDDVLHFSVDRSFPSESPDLDIWSMSYNPQPSTSYYSMDFASSENIESDRASFFGSSTLCDVTSVVDDINSTNVQGLTSVEPLLPPQSSASYEPCRDFSFAEPTLAPSEANPSSVFGQATQFGYRQTHKLDPIASFFSSSGRRPSEEYGVLSLDLPDVRSDEITVSSASCTQSCSIESLLCSEEPSPSRSRSSSLSECNHDSVVKA